MLRGAEQRRSGWSSNRARSETVGPYLCSRPEYKKGRGRDTEQQKRSNLQPAHRHRGDCRPFGSLWNIRRRCFFRIQTGPLPGAHGARHSPPSTQNWVSKACICGSRQRGLACWRRKLRASELPLFRNHGGERATSNVSSTTGCCGKDACAHSR